MKNRKQKRADKWFLLSWRKVWLIIVASFLSIIFHNLFYVLFGFEDIVFLLIVVCLMPIYFIATIVYSIIWLIENLKRGKK